jgi:predicted membrane protein
MISTFIVISVIDNVLFSLIIKMLVSLSYGICFIYFHIVMLLMYQIHQKAKQPVVTGKENEVMEKHRPNYGTIVWAIFRGGE